MVRLVRIAPGSAAQHGSFVANGAVAIHCAGPRCVGRGLRPPPARRTSNVVGTAGAVMEVRARCARSTSNALGSAASRWNFAACGAVKFQRPRSRPRETGSSLRPERRTEPGGAESTARRVRAGDRQLARRHPPAAAPAHVDAAPASGHRGAPRPPQGPSFPRPAVHKSGLAVEISRASGGEPPLPRGLKLLQTAKPQRACALRKHAQNGNRHPRPRTAHRVGSQQLTRSNKMLARPARRHYHGVHALAVERSSGRRRGSSGGDAFRRASSPGRFGSR